MARTHEIAPEVFGVCGCWKAGRGGVDVRCVRSRLVKQAHETKKST